MPTPADQPAIAAALTSFFVSLSLIAPAVRARIQARRLPTPPTDPRLRALHLALVAALIALIAWTGLLVYLGPETLGVWRPPRWGSVLGHTLLAAGALTAAVAQLQLGSSWQASLDERPTELISSGIFRVVRRPTSSGVLLMLAGLAAAAPGLWTLGFLAGTALLLTALARLDERRLEQIHGAAWRSYASKVGRFIPGLGTLRRKE